MDNHIAIWLMNAAKASLLDEVHLTTEPKTLDEATGQIPKGGYTTFRTFRRFRVLRLESHFDRLEETAHLAGKSLNVNREQVGRALYHALSKYSAAEMRVRIVIDLERQTGAIYIMVASLHAPDENAYLAGVKVVTRQLHRDNPKAKLTSFIETASAVRQELPDGINEAVMIGPDGQCLEGLTSNFYAVKNGTVWTAEKGVLSGITRSLILEVIQDARIPLRLEGVQADLLPTLEEAFISSASRAVLPVTEIDGKLVGSGLPGPVTKRLLEGYRIRLENELVDLKNFA